MAGEQLRVTEGKERGTLLSVDADLLIGRLAAEPGGRLGGDPEISRRHARVSRGAEHQLVVEDLGSANGTFVNGERIDAPRTLEAGDAIKMGKTVLEVTEGSVAVQEKSPSPAQAPAAEPAGVSGEAGEVLVIAAGTAVGRRLSTRNELVIGRAVSGEGKLEDDIELSRRHARIFRNESGQLTIEDLGSANGTFLNGERVQGPRVLTVGDSVRVGSTTLELIDTARPAASPAAPAPPPAPAPLPRSGCAGPGCTARAACSRPACSRPACARPGRARPGRTADPGRRAGSAHRGPLGPFAPGASAGVRVRGVPGRGGGRARGYGRGVPGRGACAPPPRRPQTDRPGVLRR